MRVCLLTYSFLCDNISHIRYNTISFRNKGKDVNMQDLYGIMEEMTDVKFSIESMKYLTEFLMKACEEQMQEENTKILCCYQRMLVQTEIKLNAALDMIDMEIMERKNKSSLLNELHTKRV